MACRTILLLRYPRPIRVNQRPGYVFNAFIFFISNKANIKPLFAYDGAVQSAVVLITIHVYFYVRDYKLHISAQV